MQTVRATSRGYHGGSGTPTKNGTPTKKQRNGTKNTSMLATRHQRELLVLVRWLMRWYCLIVIVYGDTKLEN